MILTTTGNIENYTIHEYLGIVSGESVWRVNIMKGAFSSEKSEHSRVLKETKEKAIELMKAQAKALGANAIVGISLDYESMHPGNILMVVATGTAVNAS